MYTRTIAHERAVLERIARLAGLRDGEQVARVLRTTLTVLQNELSRAAVEEIERALPWSLSMGDAEPPEGEPPSYRVVRSPRHHTLATGTPTSLHPLSEAHPAEAHSHSVVLEPNPHRDIKLSSAEGMTQEGVAESMATGKPDTSHTIAEHED